MESGEIAIPDFGTVTSLLKTDSLFRSYLNVYLGLPIFSRRFVYLYPENAILSYPPISDSHFLVQTKEVLRWIYDHRLAHFCRSHLYFDYQVMKEMGTDMECIEDTLRFKRFLSGSAGYLQLQFCVAVEHLKHAVDSAVGKKLALAILQTFTRNKSAARLPQHLTASLMLSLYGTTDGLQEDLPKKSSFEKIVRCLSNAQKLILTDLREYWLTKYVDCLTDGFEEEDKDKREDCRMDFLLYAKDVSCPEEADEERSGSPPVTVQNESSPDGRRVEPLVPLAAAAGNSEDPLTEDYPSPQERATDPFTRNGVKPLFSEETSQLMESIETFSLESLSDYFAASLQSDVWAGGPFLSHLCEVEEDSPSINCLLYYQGVEYLVKMDLPPEKRVNPLLFPELSKFLVPHATTIEQLLAKHVSDSATKPVNFSKNERSRLLKYLPHGLGRDLLISSQHNISKFLMRAWERYLLRDWESFMENCLSPKRHTRLTSPFEKCRALPKCDLKVIIRNTFVHQNNNHLWRAFTVAMATYCHGNIDNLYHNIPTAGLKVLLQFSSKEKRCNATSAKWFFNYHIVPPTVTTFRTMTIVTSTKRRSITICRTKKRTSNASAGKKKGKSLPKPTTFQEVLHNEVCMNLLEEFLQSKGEESLRPLEFWLTVERLKKQANMKENNYGETLEAELTIDDVHQTFFTAGANRILQCSEGIIFEMMRLPKVNIFHILAAQGAVAKAMEEKWFNEFVEYLNLQNTETDKEIGEEEQIKIFECKERTKGLWRMFAKNVIEFRRGIQDPLSANEFQVFMMDEINSALNSVNGTKKLIGTKMINLMKLHNDLSFWLEIERYRDMADSIIASKNNGTYYPEDDYILHRKAHAIVNSYVDSTVHPRIQVNISYEIAQNILDNLALGNIGRALFHEATLSIFIGLMHYWKRFCTQQFAPNASKQSSVEEVDDSSSASLNVGSNERRKALVTSEGGVELEKKESAEGGPVLSFSISKGLQSNLGRLSCLVNRKRIKVQD